MRQKAIDRRLNEVKMRLKFGYKSQADEEEKRKEDFARTYLANSNGCISLDSQRRDGQPDEVKVLWNIAYIQRLILSICQVYRSRERKEGNGQVRDSATKNGVSETNVITATLLFDRLAGLSIYGLKL